jgi:hypothetical protein
VRLVDEPVEQSSIGLGKCVCERERESWVVKKAVQNKNAHHTQYTHSHNILTHTHAHTHTHTYIYIYIYSSHCTHLWLAHTRVEHMLPPEQPH